MYSTSRFDKRKHDSDDEQMRLFTVTKIHLCPSVRRLIYGIVENVADVVETVACRGRVVQVPSLPDGSPDVRNALPRGLGRALRMNEPFIRKEIYQPFELVKNADPGSFRFSVHEIGLISFAEKYPKSLLEKLPNNCHSMSASIAQPVLRDGRA